MADYVDRIMIFPRYTTIIGTTSVYTAPMDIREYSGAILTMWMGNGLNGASAEVLVQTSTDLETWHDGFTWDPVTGDTELTSEVSFIHAWMRARADVTGSDPGVPIWFGGEFIRRERAGGKDAA